MINHEAFFDKARVILFGGVLSDMQIDIIEAILNECVAQDVTDQRQVAYCLATCYHECYNWNRGYRGRMVQLKEMGGENYLRSKKYYPFYGRGPSHLTWLVNYKMEGTRLGLDLVNNPDLMLDINIGANSHVYCMKHGSYTGLRLEDFINDIKCDYVNARRIINGTDKAQEVAKIAEKFTVALESPSL